MYAFGAVPSVSDPDCRTPNIQASTGRRHSWSHMEREGEADADTKRRLTNSWSESYAATSTQRSRAGSGCALALLLVPALALLWIIARISLGSIIIRSNGSSSSGGGSSSIVLSSDTAELPLPFESASANWTLCQAKPPHRHHAGWTRPAESFPRSLPPSSSPRSLFVQQTWENDALFLTCPPGPERWRIRIRRMEVGNLCGMRDQGEEEGIQEAVGPPFQVTPVPGSEVGLSPEVAAHRRVIEDRGTMFLMWPCQRDLTALLRSACDGKQLCCVNHATVNEDDPCPGVLKLAVAQWTCERDETHHDDAAGKTDEADDDDAAAPPLSSVARRFTKSSLTAAAASLARSPAGSAATPSSLAQLRRTRLEQQSQQDSSADTRWHTDMGTLDTLNPIVGMPFPAPSNSRAAAPFVPAAPGAVLAPRTCLFSTSLSEGPKQGIGLWNQLQTLTYALALAQQSHCNISVDAFLPDFDSLTGVPLSMVLDLQATRRNMQREFGAAADKGDQAQREPPQFDDAVEEAASDAAAAAPTSPSVSTSVAVHPSDYVFVPTLFDTPDVGYSTQWSRPYGSRCFAMSNLLESSYVLSNRTLFDSYVSLLRSHPDPGTLWMTQMWGSWVQAGAHAHIDKIKYRMFVCVEFTAPFMRTAMAMQRALGLAPRSYVAIHFRFEDDMARFLASKSRDASTATAESQLEAAWVRFCGDFERSLGPDRIKQPQDVYLATGLRSAHRFVRRMRDRYPHMRIHTKDTLLADYCDELQSASSSTATTPSPLTSEFLTSLSALPWVGAGLGSPRASCGWLSGRLPHPPNREYWAVLDYLLASDARIFIGATLKPDSAFTKGVRAKIEQNNRDARGEQTKQEVHVFY